MTTVTHTAAAGTSSRSAVSTGVGLLVLRVVLGIVMIVHGWQKFFVDGISGVEGFFTQVGVPLPGISAVVVAIVELVGGVLMVLGLGTRIVGALYAVCMIGAIVFVHASAGFLAAAGGYEFVLLLAAASAAIALTGAGRYGVDALIRR
ncbi:MAG TPA: DoxX family protein [Nakamurella sp.]